MDAAAARQRSGSGPQAGAVALVGLRGAGKSSVGKRLAERLGFDFEDLDQRLLRLARAAHPDSTLRDAGHVLRELGEPRFRELESLALTQCLDESSSLVLATGGGVVESPSNRRLLRDRSRCLWLKAEAGTLLERTSRDATDRPPLTSLDPLQEIEELSKRRDAFYQEVALFVVETDGLSVNEVADRSLAHLRP